MKKIIMNSMIAFAAAALVACGGSSSSSSKPKSESRTGEIEVRDMDIKFEGEPQYEGVTPSIGYFAPDGGGIGVRVNGVSDGEGGVKKTQIEDMRIEPVESGSARNGSSIMPRSTSELVCRPVKAGEAGSGDMFDVVISLDTTASMGPQAKLFAERVVDLAGALEEQGLDVMFAGITVGDAFATLKNEGSDYSSKTVKGTMGEPPVFDGIERPDTGHELVSVDAIQKFFTEVSEVVGTGLAGGDGPENFLAPLDYMNQHLNFREGAGRFMIAIGDECAHSADTLVNIAGYDAEDLEHNKWLPRNAEEIEEDFVTQGIAVHLIWDDWALERCNEPYYNISSIQKKTGGAASSLASVTDLITLPIIESVGNKRETVACEMPETGTEFKITFDILLEGEDPSLAKWSVEAEIGL